MQDAIRPFERVIVEPLYSDVQDKLPEGTKRRVRVSHTRSQSARGEGRLQYFNYYFLINSSIST